MSSDPTTTNANAPPPAEGGTEDAVAAFVAAATAPAAAAASTTDSNSKKRPAAAGNNDKTTTTKKKKRRVLKKKISSKSWNDMFVQYVQFQAQHKKFSGKTPKMSPELDSFVRAQRQQYTANSNNAAAASASENTTTTTNPWALTPERIQVLNFVAFEWKEQTPQVQEYNKLWNERFLELSEYKRVHGHCNVPQGYGPLGKWVKHQREGKKEAERRAGEGQAGQNAAGGPTKNKKVSTICLSQERIDKLDSIGFTWRRRGPMPDWEARYQQLIEYQRINGDTLVPQSYPPDTTFGKWVMKQRSEYSQRQRGMKSTMSDERMQKLNAIGFYWVSPKFNPKNRDAAASDKRQPQQGNNSRPSPSRYGGGPSHNHYNADADRYHYI